MLFKPYMLIVFLAILLIFVLAPLLLAQTQGETISWSDLGVDVGIIGVIVALTQFVKQYIPKQFRVWLPIVLSVAAFFISGSAAGGHYENVFYWAAAAVYFYKLADTVSGGKLKKA